MGNSTGRGKTAKVGTANPSKTLAPLQEPPNGKILVPKEKTHSPRFDGPISSLTRMMPGGKEAFMKLARLAPQIEPELSRFVDEFDRVQTIKKNIDLDAICRVKEIDPLHVIAVVGEAAMKFRDNACIILAALQMPDVVQKTIKTALTTNGHRDRKYLLQHANFIPTPQGSRVNVFNSANARAEANADKETPEGLPSFESSMRTLDALEEE